jgi:hypothetical protein
VTTRRFKMKKIKVLLYCLLIISVPILSSKTYAQCPQISGSLDQGYVPGGGGHPFWEPSHGNADEFGVVDNEEFYVKVGSYPPIKAFRKTDACTYYYSSYDTDNDRFPLDFDMTEDQSFEVKTYRILFDESLNFESYIVGYSVYVTPPSEAEVGFPQDFLMKYDGTPHQVAWNLNDHPWVNYVSEPQYYIPQQNLEVNIIGPDEIPYNGSKEFVADIDGGAGLYNITWYLRDYPNGTFTEVKSTPDRPVDWESNYYIVQEPPAEAFYFYDDEYRYNLTMQGHDVQLKVVVDDYGTNGFSDEDIITISSIPVITLINNIEDSDDFGNLFLKNNTNNNTYLIASGTPTPSLDFGTDYLVRTNELPFLVDWDNTGKTEKHYRWLFDNPNNPQEYNLSNSFTFQTSTQNPMKAAFNPTISAELKNIIDGCDVGGGKIKFKDPWRYYQDQPGNWQQTNTFIEYPANLELYNNSGNSYGGVFKNQSLNSDNPHYSVESPPTNLYHIGHPLYFQNWTGTNVEIENSYSNQTGIVFTDDNATVKANLKGHLLSDKTTAFASNGQRNLIRDKNSIYHIFYISMFKIWHTHSLTSNFNGSWSQEEEVPLYYGCYHPVTLSVDYDGDNQIVLVYVGEDAYLDYTVINLDGSLDRTHSFSSNYIDYDYLNSVLPVVSFSPNHIMIVYKPAANVGLYYARSYKITISPWQDDEGIIPHTDMSSLNPSIASNKTNTDFYLAFQQGNALYTSINYCQVSPNLPLNFDISTISIPSGYNQNYSPSINLYRSSYSGYRPMVSWTAKNIGTLGKKSNTTGAQIPEPRMVCRNQDNLGTWGDFFVAGQSVNYSYNNSVISTTYGQSVIAWSQLDGAEVKWVRRDPSEPSGFSNTTCLEPAGLIPNITTGISFSSVKAFTCDGTSLPAILNPAVTDFSQTPVCGGQQKITLPYDLTYSRSGVLSKDIIEFVFNTGDIINGDSVIRFINVPDTLQYHSAGELNSSLLTENFILNQNSDLSFTNYYYVINTEASDSLLSETDAINFKVELVSASTNQVIGTFDNITFTKENLDNYENISYRVDCTGITEGEYFMRIVTSVTGDVNYNLINTQNDASVVAKRTYNDVGYTGQEIPVIYDLSQNYPNPYNPATTINYQLPKNGFVTVKVYDILGKEVATLVNEQKTQGRYAVNFNASHLASGVYIYQLRVNDYVSSKKMLLLK